MSKRKAVTGPVEKKVTAATGSAAVSGFILWILSTYLFAGEVPMPVMVFVTWLVMAVSAFVGGYLARHTDRPDLLESQIIDVDGRHEKK